MEVSTTMNKIKINCKIVKRKSLDTVDMDGEVVMMNLDKGKYYGLNSVGSHIWELIDQPISVEDVITTLLSEYEIDRVSCEETVLQFLNGLYEEELIQIV